MKPYSLYPYAAALAAIVLVAAGCSESPVASDRVVGPIAMTVVSGDTQSALANTELPNPLVVMVTDDKGHPARDQIVNFRVVAGGGSVYGGTSLTNRDGIAQDWWTLGATGAQTVEVRAVDPTTGEKKLYATFNATVTPPPPPPPSNVPSDVFEPNDVPGFRTYATLQADGTFNINNANFHTDTDVDWYRFRTSDNGTGCVFPGSSQSLQITAAISGVPADNQYRISIYDLGILRGSQFVSANQISTVVYGFSGTCGTDDSKTFDVKVERISGDLATTHYNVQVRYIE